MRSTLALCAMLLAFSGCYSYRPANLETVPVGAGFRGLLATEARIGLEDRLRLRLDYVEGTLVERSGDSLIVEMRSQRGEDGRVLYQRLSLAQRDVLRVDAKRLNKPRTIALAAGIAAVTVAAIVFRASNNPGEPNGGPPPPPEAPPVGGAQTRLHN